MVSKGLSSRLLLPLTHASPRRAAHRENSFCSPGSGGPASFKEGSGSRRPAHVGWGTQVSSGLRIALLFAHFQEVLLIRTFSTMRPPPRLPGSGLAGFLCVPGAHSACSCPRALPQLVLLSGRLFSPLCVTGSLSPRSQLNGLPWALRISSVYRRMCLFDVFFYCLAPPPYNFMTAMTSHEAKMLRIVAQSRGWRTCSVKG